MKFCFNCGTGLREDTAFCHSCGTSVSSDNASTSNNQGFQYPSGFEPSAVGTNHENMLLTAYIGDNAHKIMDGGFNWAAFFLGPIYLVYRKLYMHALIFWGLFAVIFLLAFYLLAGLVFTILIVFVLIGIKANDLYLNKAKKDVERIKVIYQHLPPDHLAIILRSEGGTNPIGAIFLNIFFFIVALIMIGAVAMALEDTMVCTSDEGGITIYYRNDLIITYTVQGFRGPFNMRDAQRTVDDIGIEQYLIDFDEWWRENTSGSCSW